MYLCAILSPLDYHGEAIFTMSIRGNSKLTHNGYSYIKGHESKNHGVTTWRCEKRHTFRCKGKVRTQMIGGKCVVQVDYSHNHGLHAAKYIY